MVEKIYEHKSVNEYKKTVLLVLSVVVACGNYLSYRVSAQPSQPRSSFWVGTNSAGEVLCVEEDNSDLRHGPVLGGWLLDSCGRHPLLSPAFSYSDNKFFALYLARGKTNRVEIIYTEGSEADGIAIGEWKGQTVKFYAKTNECSITTNEKNN